MHTHKGICTVSTDRSSIHQGGTHDIVCARKQCAKAGPVRRQDRRSHVIQMGVVNGISLRSFNGRLPLCRLNKWSKKKRHQFSTRRS